MNEQNENQQPNPYPPAPEGDRLLALSPTEVPKQKPSRWKRILSACFILNILTIIIPAVSFLLYYFAVSSAGGDSGLFLALALYPVEMVMICLLWAGVAVAAGTIALILIYWIRRRPSLKRRILLGVWLVFALVYILGFFVTPRLLKTWADQHDTQQYKQELKDGGYIVPKISLSEALALVKSCQISVVSLDNQTDPQTLKEYRATVLGLKNSPNGGSTPADVERLTDASAYPTLKAAAYDNSPKCGGIEASDDTDPTTKNVEEDISLAEATTLLQGCHLMGFYYTEHDSGQLSGRDPETSSTGIILDYQDNPLHIHIADRMEPTLIPIGRAAQKTCPNLQFWHDGQYEQKDDNGNWYLP